MSTEMSLEQIKEEIRKSEGDFEFWEKAGDDARKKKSLEGFQHWTKLKRAMDFTNRGEATPSNTTER